jgi:DNA-dependent RNA polymerase auxiliary subunit epsilon
VNAYQIFEREETKSYEKSLAVETRLQLKKSKYNVQFIISYAGNFLKIVSVQRENR